MLKRLSILIIFLIFHTSVISGQSSDNKKDSLSRIIAQPSISDSLKSDAYVQLFANYCYSLNDSCSYARKAISIAAKSSNKLLLTTYEKIGKIHDSKNQFRKAVTVYKKGLSLIDNSVNYQENSNFTDKISVSYYHLENVDSLKFYADLSSKYAILEDIHLIDLGWKYNSLGERLYELKEYTLAISYWKKGAEVFEQKQREDREASFYGKNNSYINIAMTYGRLKLWDHSTVYMTKCVAIQDSIDNSYARSWTRYVLASFYEKMGDYDKSIESLLESLLNADKTLAGNDVDENLEKELKRIKFVSTITLAGNYGHIKKFKHADSLVVLAKQMLIEGDESWAGPYKFHEIKVTIDFLKGDTAKAIETCIEILNDKKNTDDKYFYANHYAKYLLKGKKYTDVIRVLSPYLKDVDNGDTNYELESVYILLSQAYAKVGQYKKAYLLEQQFKIIQDSIRTDERSLSMLKTAIQFDYNQHTLQDSLVQANETAIHNKNLKIEQDKSKTQKTINIILAIGLALVFILGLWAVRNAFLNKKANRYIQKQKEHVEAQKLNLEYKNKEIIDSITYAKRIQNALLKSEDNVKENLPPHFIFFKPKDIVSGDFYWTFEKQGHLYIAVSDCTGHGVPGAFMSMLGISFLNEINATEKIYSPAEILNQLRSKIIKELGQNNNTEASKDGMDISLLKYDKKGGTIEWSGANNSLYLTKEGEIFETRGDRQPIGIHARMIEFTNHTFPIEKGNTVYLFSDGYADQFGGERKKKYKYGKFKTLITSVSNKPVSDQKKILEEEFISWKGDIPQTDDICVFGIQF